MQPINHPFSQENVTRRFFLDYLPYWPLFLVLVLAAAGGGWLYLQYKAPLYESTARILINDGRATPQNQKEFDPLSTNKVIENETEIIQSRMLLSQVAADLHLSSPVWCMTRFGGRNAYVTSPVQVQVADAATIRLQKRVYFRLENDSSVSVDDSVYRIGHWLTTRYGILRFINNPVYNAAEAAILNRDQEIRLYFSLEDPRTVVTMMQDRLKVNVKDKLSSILDLQLTDEVPRRGEDMLNDLMNVYTEAIIRNKNALTSSTLAFVDDQLTGVRRELDSIERINQRYRSDQQAVDVNEQSRLFLQNASLNAKDIDDINTQLSVLAEIEKYILSSNAAGGIVPSLAAVHDPALADLFSNLYEQQLQYESLKKTTADNDPDMLAIAGRIGSLKTAVLENIRSHRSGLVTMKENLEKTNSDYSAALRHIPGKQRSLADIEREQQVKSELYSYLLHRKEETAISHASNASDVRVVDRAESSVRPVSPNKKVVYVSAVLLAIVVGAAGIGLRESLTTSIVTRSEIETGTGLPLLAEIGYEPAKAPIVIGSGQRSIIAEQFRKLRTALLSANIQGGKKRIMVTSSMVGEGKSFIAANLAAALSLTGKKVVLIDGDLHNPSLHSRLKKQGSPGLSEYLQGSTDDIDAILQPAGTEDRLYFISAGDLPCNPSELIMNGRMEVLLGALDELFDTIILDTPPVVPVTDAYLLSQICDETLFVIRQKYTPRAFLPRIDEDGRGNILKNVSLVFNYVQPAFGSDNIYGYGYAYYQGKRLPSGAENLVRRRKGNFFQIRKGLS